MEELMKNIEETLKNNLEQETVKTVISIYNGEFRDYQEYYEFHNIMERRYLEKLNQPLDVSSSLLVMIPVKPAPLLSRRIFDYIIQLRREKKHNG